MTRRPKEDLNALFATLAASFKALSYRSPATPKARGVRDKDLCTVYIVADHHLGMYSWVEETGENYDSKIASRLLKEAMADLVAQAPSSGEGVVLNLGDFFHAENDDNRTRSGNPLDTDTRHAQILRTGIELTISAIQMALTKHRKVEYRALGGNHDPLAALALALAVEMFFHDEPRVYVNTDPSYFWVKQWGKTMLVATHGDYVRPVDLPGVAASKWPVVWGETRHRYGHAGHLHHRAIGGGEAEGLTWEIHQSLAAKDGWNAKMGFSSGRSMVAIVYHKEKGERFRVYSPVDPQKE